MTAPVHPRQGVGEAVEQLARLAKSWSDTELTSVKLPGNTAFVWSTRIAIVLAEIARLNLALHPFAEAAESLDDDHPDCSPIWESSAAMCIDARHLRTALSTYRQTKEDTA